ncbi:MAG: type II toxin-antitoxin system HicB family antitoxin [Desulfobacterales bacterium]|nr:type II toxin-antitoxin system HicB family antitoxin [Desulfobacterales bacterium]
MKKDLKYYIKLNYPITIETYTEDGKVHYSLEVPDLPGCGADGKTLHEAMKKLQDAKSLWIEVSLKRNLPIPEPISEDDFSGKFLLRIPTKLHMALSKQSKINDLSLNQYVKSILETHAILAYEEQKMKKREDKLLKAIELLTKKFEMLEKRLESFEEIFRPRPKETEYINDAADYGVPSLVVTSSLPPARLPIGLRP